MVKTILSFWDDLKLTDILVSSDIESDKMNPIVFYVYFQDPLSIWASRLTP